MLSLSDQLREKPSPVIEDPGEGERGREAARVEIIRVLFVGHLDDYSRIRILLSAVPDFHYLVDLSDTFRGAIVALRRKAYDACLVDGQRDAQGAPGFIHSNQTLFSVPIILLTEEIGASCAEPADRLIKSEITASLLDRSIRFALERKKSSGSVQESREFLRSALDALSSHIAILDENGTILSVNEPWIKFGLENGVEQGKWGPGENYLGVCDKASRAGEKTAATAAQGIRNVAQGRLTRFHLEYPCSSPVEHRWFALQVTRFMESGAARIVVAHDDITERKQAEEALASSERRFRALVERSSDITLLTNRAGEIIYTSPATTRILGYDTEELLDFKGTDFIHPEYVERVITSRDQASGLGDSAKLQMRVRHKDGSWRWVDGSLTNYLDDPSVGARVYNLQDHTARRQAEEELIRSEAKFQQLSDSGIIGIVEFDLSGWLYRANDAFLKIVGREGDDIVGGHLNILDVTAPEYLDDFPRRIAVLKSSGIAEAEEKEYLRKDGSRVPVMAGGVCVDAAAGRYLGFVIDLSRLAQAREERQRLEERYRSLFENANDAILTFNLNGNVTSINPAGEKMFGYTREELLHQDLVEIFAPEELTSYKRIRTLALSNDLPERLEVRALTRRGKRLNVELSIQPVMDAGAVVGLQCIGRDLTEKGSLEEELRQAQTTEAIGRREAKDLVQSIADTIPAIVFMTDETGKNVFSNRAWAEFSGRPIEAAYGDGWRKLLHPEDALREKGPPTFNQDGYFEFEHRMRRRDGEYRWLVGRGKSLHRQDGTLAGMVGVATDVTDQRKAADRLRVLTRAVEQSPVNILITDTKGTIEYVNPRFTEVTGYSPEEAIGQNPRILKSGHTSQDEYRHLWETIKTQEWRGEIWNKRKNGELFLVGASISPVRDRRGQVTHFLAVQKDITEQKRAEKALRRVQALNQRILESAREGITVVDLNGNIRYMSPGALDLCDSAGGCCRKTNWIDFWLPEYRSMAVSALEDCRAGKPSTVLGIMTNCGGNNRWWDASLTPMKEDPETEDEIVIVFRDVTERRQMEAQLAQAQKLESIGQLAAGIAHEINTPIQYVGDNGLFIKDALGDLISYVERLEAAVQKVPRDTAKIQPDVSLGCDFQYLREELPRAAGELLHGVETVGRIVQAMKDFSHPGTDEKTPVDLNLAIESTVTISRNEWKYVAELKMDFDPRLPLVNCLPGEINQVVLNLIVNAAHAIGEKKAVARSEEGLIVISTRHREHWVEICVSDNGPGVPDSIRAKIFDPFFTTKEVGKGTGQGLAIAHDIIVNKHGGSISVETEAGKGSSFVIRLPIEGPDVV